MIVKSVKNRGEGSVQIFLVNAVAEVSSLILAKKTKEYVKKQLGKKKSMTINHDGLYSIVQLLESTENLEKIRERGAKLVEYCAKEEIKKVHLSGTVGVSETLAMAEGIYLANYQFLKYFGDAKKRKNKLTLIEICHEGIGKKEVKELNNLLTAVYETRDLVNEPQSFLTAKQLSEEIKRIGEGSGFNVEVFDQAKIKSLKMGGLLAVNQGSVEPATFSILEWKPTDAVNTRPYVIVGKGVVYDTGGLSLKPTPNSMDIMKCDMAGAAMMIGAMSAIASNKLPIHVICLIPATDNRPGGIAYAPGDVVTMYNGKTVEVLNTDAEGRMILADALSFAEQYKPELVVDAATLTGSAARAIGSVGIVAMGNAADEEFIELNEAGEEVYERIVQFPFWEEYGDQIKSKIADIKNLGGPEAGAITAGKFLECFTNDPYIHLDIAGPAWLGAASHYRTQGGSGIGVRLMYTFFKNKCS
jgi:leucyl aminopeptidase